MQIGRFTVSHVECSLAAGDPYGLRTLSINRREWFYNIDDITFYTGSIDEDMTMRDWVEIFEGIRHAANNYHS